MGCYHHLVTRLGFAIGCLLALGPPAAGAVKGVVGTPVGRITFVEGTVERETPKPGKVEEGSPARTGDRLRTGAGGLLRLEFPWMSLQASPGSVVSVAPGPILSVSLDAGRVQLDSQADEIIKLKAGDSEVRGRGHAIVRQEGSSTLVTVVNGQFSVTAQGRKVSVERGQGCVVLPRTPPSAPRQLPEPPSGLIPGSDPRYLRPTEEIELQWGATRGPYTVQVLGIDSQVVLIEREAREARQILAIPWPGTFRWRVASRDGVGLEGLPSPEGLLCVVDR
jgi:hypothetical protein